MRDAPDAFPRSTDRQVVVSISVEVSDCERGSEPVMALIDPRNARRVLVPELLHEGSETILRTVDDVDSARVDLRAEVLPGQAHRLVHVAVTVEVASDDLGPEAVASLRHSTEA